MDALLINGDDYGMNEHISSAVAQAFCCGAVTDTSMAANGSFFDEAIRLARRHGFDDRIGIHFNLTEGAPLTSAITRIPDFTDNGAFIKDYIRRPRPLDDAECRAVFDELSAQAERIRQAGITMTHADSHHYIHNITFLAPIVAQVCRDYGIGRIRLKRNIGDATGDSENNAFWRDRGFVTTDHFGRMSDMPLDALSGAVEIMVHPDYDRTGRLIDRTGIEDGCPVGIELKAPEPSYRALMCSYRDLRRR